MVEDKEKESMDNAKDKENISPDTPENDIEESKSKKRQEMYIIEKEDDDTARRKKRFLNLDRPTGPPEPMHTETPAQRERKQKKKIKKGNIRSLVVDDEFVSLTKMTTILSDYGDSDAATHGEQAYKLFTEAIAGNKAYDLITIDIGLPGMDGLELLRKICDYEQVMMVSPAKKVMITVDSEYKTVVKAAKSRCSAFLVKPIRKKVLINKLVEIEAVARTVPKEEEEEEVNFNDFESPDND